jgi:hypothetical protein
MASTWIGGGNNKASNPKNWSPEGVPTHTDAEITHGRINIEGNELADQTTGRHLFLDVLGGASDVIIDLRHGLQQTDVMVRPIDVQSGNADIEIKDSAQFELFAQAGASVHINELPHAVRWSGTFSVEGDLKVFGNGTFVPSGNDSLVVTDRNQPPAHAFLDVTIAKGLPIHVFNASLELGGFVSAGETIALVGDPDRPSFLKLDIPRIFAGTVNLGRDSQVDLVDLVKREHVDSYALKNDLLAFYDHNEVRYTLAVTGSAPLTVAQAGGDVFVYTDAVAPPGSTLLPLHG